MAEKQVSIAVLPGDGIGPEVSPWAERVLTASNEILGAEVFQMQRYPYDGEYFLQNGRAWPEGEAARLAQEHHAALLIALGHPTVGMKHAVSIILDGFRGDPAWLTNVNSRPADLLDLSLAPKLQQGPFSHKLHSLTLGKDERIEEEVQNRGTAEEEIIVTETHSVRAFREKLESAVFNARMSMSEKKKVIVVHKANVFSNSHGPWIDKKNGVLAEVQRANQDIQIEEQLMDSFLERLITNPASVPEHIVTDVAFDTVLEKALKALQEGKREPIPEGFNSLIIRENTEGMYVRGGGIEGEGDDRVGTQIGKHTRKMIEANIEASILAARERGLDTITVLHLDDAHPEAYALWKKVATEICSLRNIAVNFMHAGDYVATLIKNPSEVNNRVFAADNVLGDICGDAAAAIVGGMGIPATHSYNNTKLNEGERRDFFEPLHGSAPDIAGQQKADPTASISTSGLILGRYGHRDLQELVRQSLVSVLAQGDRTRSDPKGTLTTGQFGQKVIDNFLQLAL